MVKEGESYEIRLKGDREPCMTALYIGEGSNGDQVFSLRPIAGTQTFHPGDIEEVTHVPGRVVAYGRQRTVHKR